MTMQRHIFVLQSSIITPVVGVSWQQASRYCEWLTDRANESELMKQGVINKDYYANDANNQGANAFNLDKFKSNDQS